MLIKLFEVVNLNINSACFVWQKESLARFPREVKVRELKLHVDIDSTTRCCSPMIYDTQRNMCHEQIALHCLCTARKCSFNEKSEWFTRDRGKRFIMHQASDDLLLITRLAMSSEKLPQSSTTTFVGEKSETFGRSKTLNYETSSEINAFPASLLSFARFLRPTTLNEIISSL